MARKTLQRRRKKDLHVAWRRIARRENKLSRTGVLRLCAKPRHSSKAPCRLKREVAPLIGRCAASRRGERSLIIKKKSLMAGGGPGEIGGEATAEAVAWLSSRLVYHKEVGRGVGRSRIVKSAGRLQVDGQAATMRQSRRIGRAALLRGGRPTLRAVADLRSTA